MCSHLLSLRRQRLFHWRSSWLGSARRLRTFQLPPRRIKCAAVSGNVRRIVKSINVNSVTYFYEDMVDVASFSEEQVDLCDSGWNRM